VLVASPDSISPSAAGQALLRSGRCPARLAVPHSGEDGSGAGPGHLYWFTPTRSGNSTSSAMNYAASGTSSCVAKWYVEEEREFQAWLSSHPSSRKPQRKQPAMLQQASRSMQCVPLPWLAKEGNLRVHAPKLSGQGDWYLKRQLNISERCSGTHDKACVGQDDGADGSDAG